MKARSLPEIEAALEQLVDRWSRYSGTERSGSQTFLNQLIRAYTGAEDVIEAGATFEQFGPRDEGVGFMDLYWPGVTIVEMKAPKESGRLDSHRAQVLDYWRNSADPATGTPAPPFLVLCSIRSFEVWEPGRFPNAPRDVFTIEELPSRAEALLFLAGKTPVYGGPGAAVTQEAAQHMVDLYFQLLDREAAPAEELRRFIVQAVWVLFAEDLGLVPERVFANLIDALATDSTRDSAVEITDLFRRFNQPDAERRDRGRSVAVPYVNGELFAATPEVPLNPGELRHLQAAAAYDWRWVNPTVFGSLLEGCLGHDHRWELGAHYTNEEDILSIVRPVIVHPWAARIEAVDDPKKAVKLLVELTQFHVLDPAMGCANFLAIAYRELRKLERRLSDRISDLYTAAGMFPPTLPRYPLRNIHGIEIDPFAVEIAKATLWMTHALMARQYGAAEDPLPLQSLDTLDCADSLKIEWPKVDAIIGNPPFHGDRRLREVVGDAYIDGLKSEFGVGVKDHCVYFFRKAHTHLSKGQRAGLVATNTISQAKNRDASLVWIVANGGTIFEATSTKPWSGDAKVHVSIVCWEKGVVPPPPYLLDGREVEGITPSLTAGTEHRAAVKLAGNAGVGFVGYFPNGMGFVLDEDEAASLLGGTDADYSTVVFPFINGEDIVDRVSSDPSRWIIDFGRRALEEAGAFPAALDIVREKVKPFRDGVSRKAHRERWWQFAETRPGMTAALAPLTRYALAGLTGKRWIVAWGQPGWRPSHALAAFAFDDDYSFGVLASRPHDLWARANGSTLKGDLRYTPSTCFDTFPWPTNPNDGRRATVAEAARRIVTERSAACQSLGKGLTAVYNAMDEGAFVNLKKAHDDLDRAVLACYGLPASLIKDRPALLSALFDLNEKAAADSIYDPFGRRDSGGHS
ncbi:MAG: hypothetical protein PHN51_09610 [Candidatus Nanopelagicales bacterium]|nr:hypothetical protein [Candidatus Nanopelagicales bacterium]MDD2819033.1 hypothetical protein [Candidatus Nanopelagicales bacterium]